MGGCIGNSPRRNERLTEDDLRLKKYYPLHFACQQNDADRVQTLLQQRESEINVFDHRGYTPLIVAITCEHWFVVSMLAQESRCDFSLTDKEGNAPIHHVVLKAPIDIITTICKKSPIDLINRKRETALARAARAKNLGAIKTLLENGADVNGSHRSRRGLPLMNAIKKSWVEGAKFFLDHADIDLNAKPGPRGEGFLWCRHSEILDHLLQTDINVSLADDQGILADEWLDAQNLSENAGKIRLKRERERKQILPSDRQRFRVSLISMQKDIQSVCIQMNKSSIHLNKSVSKKSSQKTPLRSSGRRPEVGGRRLPRYQSDLKSSRFNRQVRAGDSSGYFTDVDYVSSTRTTSNAFSPVSERALKRSATDPSRAFGFQSPAGAGPGNGAGAQIAKEAKPRAASQTFFPATPDTNFSKNFTPDTATPSDNPIYSNHPLYHTLVPQGPDVSSVNTQTSTLMDMSSPVFDEFKPDYDEPDYDYRPQKRGQYRAQDFTSPIV